MNDVRLVLGGRSYAGWESVRIARGLDRAAADFTLAVSERWDYGAGPIRIRPDESARLYIDDDLVLTGYVDEVQPSYDATRHGVAIRGRSKTADLIDCAARHRPGQWRALPVERIAADIAGEYGVKVVAEVDTGAPIPDHQVQQGETAFASIERLAALRALLVTDNPAGDLVLTRGGTGATGATGRSAFRLVKRKDDPETNVESATGRFSHRDRYATYIVKGQAKGGDDFFGAAAAESLGEASDPGVRRNRVHVIVAPGGADSERCQKLATNEAATRAGRAIDMAYTVATWRDAGGGLLTVNQLVTVSDDMMPIEATLLIAEVAYERSLRTGTRCVLRVMPPAAFDLVEAVPGSVHDGIEAWAELDAIFAADRAAAP